jgi:hypothetical protein
MQIAEQVFKLETAANGLCFFSECEMAYFTKRFDMAPFGGKYRVDDELSVFTANHSGIDKLIKNSFLSKKIKR